VRKHSKKAREFLRNDFSIHFENRQITVDRFILACNQRNEEFDHMAIT
jgi:hypothetical protein